MTVYVTWSVALLKADPALVISHENGLPTEENENTQLLVQVSGYDQDTILSELHFGNSPSNKQT
jgi:hypothetical protein